MTPAETRSRSKRYFRVDPRFVHATIVNNWVPATNARVAMIVDSGVALDPKRRAIFEMSAMGAIDVVFCDEHNAAETLESCSTSDPVIVLFPSLDSALQARKAGLAFDKLNIGHVPVGPGRTELHPAVFLGDAEYATIDRLQKLGVEVQVQPLPHDKLKILPRRSMKPSEPPAARPQSARVEQRCQVVNEKGLHLRAAHVLAHLTSSLPAEIRIGTKGNMVNGKSLLGLTTLGATCGTFLDVVVDGEGAEAGLEAIVNLFASGFEEGVDPGADEESDS